MHITYEFRKKTTLINLTNTDEDPSPAAVIALIDQRITILRREAEQMRKICIQLSKFLKANSIVLFNDDLLEYLRHNIEEEKLKRSANAANEEVIRNLEQMIIDYKEEMKLYNETVNMTDATLNQNADQVKPIFDLVKQLYRLPINGASIKEQVEGIDAGQTSDVKAREITVDLLQHRHTSKVRSDLIRLLNNH